jgi:hypothetical protein
VNWETSDGRTGFRTMHVPRVYAVAGPAYGGAVLALYTYVGVGERALGVLTWLVLLCALWPLPALARAQALGVVAFATIGEVTGSIVWGIYHYRSHDLPLFVPPGHGLVYLTGLAVARIVGERRIVWAAAVGSVGWGLAGLTLLPRLDVAGGLGVAVLGAFLWRSRARAAYAGVFFVVAALELYGTSIGAWHWTRTLPGLGITDGNPPSGAASGYVGFDMMAMLVAPTLVCAAAKLKPKRANRRVHEAREPVGASADRGNWRLQKSRPGVVDLDTSFRAPTRTSPA